MPGSRDSVAGATVVIAGASSGIGRGAALRLAAQGANVVVAARRTEVLDQLVAEIQSQGGAALAVTADVSEVDDILRLAAAAVDRFERIDIWINNVGVGALGMFWDIPLKDHARLVDVNLKGLIFGSHEALRRFREQGFGTLVNIGSVDSEIPIAFQNTYAATKAAVLSLGRSLNEELRLSGNDHIKVGIVMPWAIDTPWWAHAANYTGHAPRMALMDDPEIVIDAIVSACTDPREAQPAGAKARAANATHHIFPDLTERMSAGVARREIHKADPVPSTTGALHEPMAGGTDVQGGVRERMKREDSQ